MAAWLVAVAILLIDGALTAVHYTPSQDAVGLTAAVVGFGTAIFVVIVAIRWWRRPAVTISYSTVTTYRRRPLAVPWPMIVEVIRGAQSGSSGHRALGVLLADSRFITVNALRHLAEPVARPQGLRAESAATPYVPAYPDLSAQETMPDALAGPTLQLSCWVTLTRVITVGSGWIAWRPRFTWQWRVLAPADVVSTIDLQWPRRRGVRLSRADSSGLRLRPAELAAGIGPELARQLAEHPAATAEFLEALQEAPPAASDQLAAQIED